MAYNLGALRRAIRANMSEEDREAVKAAARGIDLGRPTSGTKKRRSGSKRRSKSVSVRGGKVTARRRSKSTSKRHSGSKRKGSSRRRSKSGSKRKSSKRGSKRGSKRKTSKRTSKRKSSKRGSKRASKAKGRATAKGASASARSASKALTAAKKAVRRASKATSKKGAASAARSARKAASRAKKAATAAKRKASKAKPSSKRAASKAATKAARAAVSAEAAAARASRLAMQGGRLSRKVGRFSYSSKTGRKYRKVKGFSAAPFTTGRMFNPAYHHFTGKHPRRAGSIRMAANVLARVSQRGGRAVGQRVQLVEFGPRSKRRGYSTYVPGYVSERSYVRKFRFGGAARAAHSKAIREGYARSKRSKRVSANRSRRRKSMRRNSKRRGSKRRHSRRHSRRRVSANRYVLVNGRRRRRMRRNMTIMGIDPVEQVLKPGGAAVLGLMAANAAANAAANVESVRNILDSGRPADEAIWTKTVVGAGVAAAALMAAPKMPPIVRSNIGAIVAGMGCAVAVRLLRGTQAAPYLGRLGEYVNSPLSGGIGAYVRDPSMGEYVDTPLGEYVNSPLSGLGGGMGTMYAAAGYPEGIDPADQGSVDGLMDTMEAAAGVGAYEAAAGMGTAYALADADVQADLVAVQAPRGAFRGSGGSEGFQQPPFVSIEQPIDLAAKVTGELPRDLPIPTSMVTREGKGYAGGIFSRSLFAGLMA